MDSRMSLERMLVRENFGCRYPRPPFPLSSSHRPLYVRFALFRTDVQIQYCAKNALYAKPVRQIVKVELHVSRVGFQLLTLLSEVPILGRGEREARGQVVLPPQAQGAREPQAELNLQSFNLGACRLARNNFEGTVLGCITNRNNRL